jgi:hypothetical protein
MNNELIEKIKELIELSGSLKLYNFNHIKSGEIEKINDKSSNVSVPNQ